ncbi:MAG: hypothetical protein HYT94_00310 [Parcubacteria group bacterium]|nr:hypothetical protein [Parcubacteria group bacterium]
MKRNLIIFASGEKTDGGTGAENLVKQLPGRTLAIISSNENGGVRRRADALAVPFFYFSGPYTTEGYCTLIDRICTEMKVSERDLWYALSGWFRQVYWLDPARTFNIHSGPLPKFSGLWGDKLHHAVWEAYKRGEITESEIVMHFVTEKIDDGPIFFRTPVSFHGIETFEEFEKATHQAEHAFQPKITRLVLDKQISWDGVHPESLNVPDSYTYL